MSPTRGKTAPRASPTSCPASTAKGFPRPRAHTQRPANEQNARRTPTSQSVEEDKPPVKPPTSDRDPWPPPPRRPARPRPAHRSASAPPCRHGSSALSDRGRHHQRHPQPRGDQTDLAQPSPHSHLCGAAPPPPSTIATGSARPRRRRARRIQHPHGRLTRAAGIPTRGGR